MTKYVAKRLLYMIPVLLGVAFLVFSILSLTPGDPGSIILGITASKEDIAALNAEFGYDKPFLIRFFNYIGDIVFHFNLGVSYQSRQPVIQDIVARFPNTLLLTVFSMSLSALIGILLGIVSAVRQYSVLDHTCVIVALVFASIPGFWLGLMLMLIFCVILKWLPITAEVSFVGMILPSLTLSARSLATIARMTRSSMLEVMSQDYILTAKAQGFNSRKIIFSHALKNAMNSIVTVAGIQFGTLLGGSVITEKVYGWPGLGELVITAIKARDFPVVQTTILVIAVSFVAVNLFVDVLYVLINPRIKYV